MTSAKVTVAEPGPGPVAVADLCARYHVDPAHAGHVASLALALFDRLGDVHGLPRPRRALLKTAALLHNVGLAVDAPNHHVAGRDIVLQASLQRHSRAQRDMIAACIRFHRKRVRPAEEPVFAALSPDLQRQTLALAAILRVADGLDYSGTQATRIAAVRYDGEAVSLLVDGPAAATDAARAIRKADLWGQVFGLPLDVTITAPNQSATDAQPAAPEPSAPATTTAEAPPPTAGPPATPATEWPPAAPARRWPEVQPGLSVPEAAGRVLAFYFDALRAHERDVLKTMDAEAVHDLRVATRRLRAALRLFRPDLPEKRYRRVRDGLRETAQALGAVRDLDVALARAREYRDSFPASERPDLRPLTGRWKRQQRRAVKRLHNRLGSRPHRAFLRAFAKLTARLAEGGVANAPDAPGQPVQAALAGWVHAGYDRLLAYERPGALDVVESLHALRIDCKRLRYTLEFCRDLTGQPGEQLVEELVAAQDHLGELHDADVAATRLRALLAKHDPAGDSPKWAGVRGYLASREAALQQLRAAVPERWSRLTGPKVRRAIARLTGEAQAGLPAVVTSDGEA